MYFQDNRRVPTDATPCHVTFLHSSAGVPAYTYETLGILELDERLSSKPENARVIQKSGYYFVFTYGKKRGDTASTPTIIVCTYWDENRLNDTALLCPQFIWSNGFQQGNFDLWKDQKPSAYAFFEQVQTKYFQNLDQIVKLSEDVRFVMPLYFNYALYFIVAILVLRILTYEFTITTSSEFNPTWYNFVYPLVLHAPTIVIKLVTYAMGYTDTLRINDTFCFLGPVFSRLVWLFVKFVLIEHVFAKDIKAMLIESDLINFYDNNIVYWEWLHQIAIFFLM